MLREFALPDLGEGLTESEVVAWRVAVGDHIELNQVIADIETAKAVVELPSPFAGTVAALHADAGETVEVGAPLVSFELDGGEPTEPNLVGYGAAADAAPRRRARVGRAAAAAPGAAGAAGERPRSTPPVRTLARELGVDLGSVLGTGDGGLITRADVEGAASGSGSSAAGEVQPGTRTPIRGVRKATAAAMVASAFTAPHVTEFLTVDVTATSELIERLRSEGARVNLLAVTAKAVCIALRRTPELNSRWDEPDIVAFEHVNLGIAAATDRGLVVPNIPRAQTLNLLELAEAIAELARTARAGTTGPAALRDGTFTITNIGVFGIDAGTPILNPGEAGILALGAVRRMPWEFRGEVALRDTLTLSLSFDHRVVDGQQGSRFLADVGAMLRDPARVMAMV